MPGSTFDEIDVMHGPHGRYPEFEPRGRQSAINSDRDSTVIDAEGN